MVNFLNKIKEIEKNFSKNQDNKSAIIFDEAKNIVFDANSIKIEESQVELFFRVKNILQTLYFGVHMQVMHNNIRKTTELIPEISLVLNQISAEIIDILEDLFGSIIHGRNMIGFSLIRMLKERILYLMILTQESGEFPERCKLYYDFYKAFVGKFFSDDIKEMDTYYWWKKIYPNKSISQLMIDYKIYGYSHDSYHSHGGYGTHLDCNISRRITDSEYENASQDLVYEYFWLAGNEMLALTIDGYSKLKGYMNDLYYDSVILLLKDLYKIWGQTESDFYSSAER